MRLASFPQPAGGGDGAACAGPPARAVVRPRPCGPCRSGRPGHHGAIRAALTRRSSSPATTTTPTTARSTRSLRCLRARRPPRLRSSRRRWRGPRAVASGEARRARPDRAARFIPLPRPAALLTTLHCRRRSPAQARERRCRCAFARSGIRMSIARWSFAAAGCIPRWCRGLAPVGAQDTLTLPQINVTAPSPIARPTPGRRPPGTGANGRRPRRRQPQPRCTARCRSSPTSSPR